jgi:biotin carboxyl carrier protein
LKKLEARSEVAGSVWKIMIAVGQQLAPGAEVMIVESMKMEIPVIAEEGGVVVELRVAEGQAIGEGEVVAVLEVSA